MLPLLSGTAWGGSDGEARPRGWGKWGREVCGLHIKWRKGNFHFMPPCLPCPLAFPFLSSFFFPFCFKCKIPSGDSDYKPPASFRNCKFIASIFNCVHALYVCVCVCTWVTHYRWAWQVGLPEPMRPRLLKTPTFLPGPSPSRKHKCPNLVKQLSRPRLLSNLVVEAARFYVHQARGSLSSVSSLSGSSLSSSTIMMARS